jgi:hypothetical protein
MIVALRMPDSLPFQERVLSPAKEGAEGWGARMPHGSAGLRAGETLRHVPGE